MTRLLNGMSDQQVTALIELLNRELQLREAERQCRIVSRAVTFVLGA